MLWAAIEFPPILRKRVAPLLQKQRDVCAVCLLPRVKRIRRYKEREGESKNRAKKRAGTPCLPRQARRAPMKKEAKGRRPEVLVPTTERWNLRHPSHPPAHFAGAFEGIDVDWVATHCHPLLILIQVSVKRSRRMRGFPFFVSFTRNTPVTTAALP